MKRRVLQRNYDEIDSDKLYLSQHFSCFKSDRCRLKGALERTAEHLELDKSGEIVFSPRFIEPKPEYYNYDMYEGVEYAINLQKEIGQRIVRLNFKGHQVKDDEILEIVVNQYRAVGGGNYPMFSADKIVREITVDMTELIADYLKKHPIIEASVNHNFTVLK